MENLVYHPQVFSFLGFRGRISLARTSFEGSVRQRKETGHDGLVFRWAVQENEDTEYCQHHLDRAHRVFRETDRLGPKTTELTRSLGRSEPVCSLFIQEGFDESEIAAVVSSVPGLRFLEYTIFSGTVLCENTQVFKDLLVNVNQLSWPYTFFSVASPSAERIGWISSILHPLGPSIKFSAFTVSGDWFELVCSIVAYVGEGTDIAISMDSSDIDLTLWKLAWEGYRGGAVYISFDSCRCNGRSSESDPDGFCREVMSAVFPMSVLLAEHPHPADQPCHPELCHPQGVFDVTQAFPFLVPRREMFYRWAG